MATQDVQSSRLTQKCQATIPQSVRDVLGLAPGDRIVFEFEAGRVFIKKLQPLDLKYLQSVFKMLDEWASTADEIAYRDL